MTKTYASDSLVDFLNIFGDDRIEDPIHRRELVREQLYAYWQERGFVQPPELYSALMRHRTDISPEKKDALSLYFHHSFMPEHTTGYYDCHRAPLVDALMREYVDAYMEKPLYCVESDLLNLGGLNLAIGNEHRELADQVIGVISGIVRDELEKLGAVCAVRHGGDESSLLLTPKQGIAQPQIESALQNAQHKILDFITEAGLRDIPRPVYEDTPDNLRNNAVGTGIGLGVEQVLPGISTMKQQLNLEEGILVSKHYYSDLLAKSREQCDTPQRVNLDGVRHAIQVYQRYLPTAHILFNNSVMDANRFARSPIVYGDGAPEELRGIAARKKILDEPINNAEMAALQATLAVTKRYDFVTDMPIFPSMQHELLPQFVHRFKTHMGDVRLLHVDFSNLGGGNLLGSWVGDAMAHQFANCVRDAFRETGLGDYIPYLTSNRGGRFTALLPANIDAKDMAALRMRLVEKIDAQATQPLALTDEEKEQSAALLKTEKLQAIYADGASPFDANGDVLMGQLRNKKPGAAPGVAVAVAWANIKPEMPLGEALRLLEAKTKLYQNEPWQWRMAYEQAVEAQQSGYAARLAAERGAAPGAGSESEAGSGDRAASGGRENPIAGIVSKGAGGARGTGTERM